MKCDKCNSEVKKRTLEEKFQSTLNIEDYTVRKLAQIAEEHFKEDSPHHWFDIDHDCTKVWLKGNGYVKREELIEELKREGWVSPQEKYNIYTFKENVAREGYIKKSDVL